MIRTSLVLSLIAVGMAWEASADVISLRGGGTIQGVIVNDPAKPDVVLIQTGRLARPLVFQKSQVLQVTRQASPLDEYLANRDRIDATAQAQHDFGLWCEENKLVGLAELHFARAVELDPQFAASHKKLGHVLHGGRWMTYDQQREAQGLVKHKGRWISHDEKDSIDAKAALSSQQSSWASRIKLLRAKLYGTDPAARAQAETQLNEIRDPAAVPGLVRAFSADSDAMRVRLASSLSVIDGDDATEALVSLIVAEENLDVRQSMLDSLLSRHDPETASKLMAYLKHKNSRVIGRAAWALAASKTVSAVPRLVEALTQSEKQLKMVPVVVGSSGGGLGGSFTFAQGVSGGPAIPPSAASQGFAVVGAYPVLTGVAVGPGVVAYGAGSVLGPVGNTPVSGVQEPITRTMPQQVTVVFQNGEVLAALESLTGVTFGYDRASWRKWISTSFHPDAEPVRRVPQP